METLGVQADLEQLTLRGSRGLTRGLGGRDGGVVLGADRLALPACDGTGGGDLVGERRHLLTLDSHLLQQFRARHATGAELGKARRVGPLIRVRRRVLALH